MVRKLLKTKDNRQQIKFIIMCSSNNWKLHDKVNRSRLDIVRFASDEKQYDMKTFLICNKINIRKS